MVIYQLEDMMNICLGIGMILLFYPDLVEARGLKCNNQPSDDIICPLSGLVFFYVISNLIFFAVVTS